MDSELESPGQPGRPAARSLQIETIQTSSVNWTKAQMLLRAWGPSAVTLPNGQHENVLVCHTGQHEARQEVRSILRAEGRVYEWRQLPDQAITFIPAAFACEWEWTYYAQATNLIIPPSSLGQVATEMQAHGSSTGNVRPQFRVYDSIAADLMARLQRELIGQGYGTGIAVDAMINLLLVHLLYAYSGRPLPPGPKQNQLSPAQRSYIISLIEERLEQNIPLYELAGSLYLSQYHYCRLFKSSFGVAPHEYQLQRRILRARDLLRAGRGISVSHVAATLGFSDEGHFRRHFKRIVGITPRQYRGETEDSQDRT